MAFDTLFCQEGEKIKINRCFIQSLNDLKFMDSSGIGVILGRYRLMQKRGGSVCVRSRNSRVDRLLNVAGLYRIVEKID
ncbi:MAG: anti-sigma factor antagonist [Desulfovibrio sp.]|nr:anti-sigma factor antagonist [Desulfovibrio sp.]